jgi:predicted RNase H-like HicB family nuclease
MASIAYRVFASWDAEAKYWIASSNEVPGLATGAATMEELIGKVRTMVPELLALNGMLPEDEGGPIDRVTIV